MPQDLQDDAVVRAILAHAQSVPLKTPVIHSDNSISFIDETTIAAPKVSAPVVTPAHGDFFKFAKLVAEYAIRRQTHSPSSDPSKPSPFVQLLGQYYQNYYQGKFVTYFGESYDQPVVSLTINDNEITQSVGLFFEFLFDYALQSPVWYDGKNYYPGNNSNLPSLLAINNRKPVTVSTLPPSSDPCGMTVMKAKIISYVATQFGTAASSDTALTVKSAGGLEVGLGVLGKLSVGDNNTLSDLIKIVVTEVVQRLTAQAGYLLFSQIDIVQSASPTVALAGQAALIQYWTTRFTSADRLAAAGKTN